MGKTYARQNIIDNKKVSCDMQKLTLNLNISRTWLYLAKMGKMPSGVACWEKKLQTFWYGLKVPLIHKSQ